MKIIYHHRVAAKDGMDVHITEMIAALTALGHEITVVGPPRGARDTLGQRGKVVSFVRRYLPMVVGEFLEILYDRLAYRRLERIYKLHKPDLIYERHNLFLTAGKRLKTKYGVPLYLEVNSPLAEERAKHGGLALARHAAKLELDVWHTADRVLPVSHVLAQHLIDKGVNERSIEVIPNGINAADFHMGVDGRSLRTDLGYGPDDIVLGFCGFVREWHGLDQVIAALSSTNIPVNVHLLVIGDGPEKPALEQLAKREQMTNRVHFSGLVERAEIPKYIAAIDIALQPAVTSYASPLKLFEYMAMGKVILAPDQPNIREILQDGVDSILLPDGQIFDDRVIELLSNRQERDKLGKAARDRIESNRYLWSENARRIVELFFENENSHSNARNTEATRIE